MFPEEINFDDLQPYYDTVAEKLQRGTLPEDLEKEDYWKHVRVMKKHCDEAGVTHEPMATATDWDIVRDEVDGKIDPAIIHGEAVYGVNSGAKSTLDNSYLREAEDTGLLEVKVLHQVDRISEGPDGKGYSIFYQELNIDGDVIAEGEIQCEKLILSAGTMGSNSLLVKAKARGDLPKLNDKVEKGWGNNGNVYGLRLGLNLLVVGTVDLLLLVSLTMKTLMDRFLLNILNFL